MSAPRLDWKSAEVSDATLTVALQGDRPKGWKASVESTARLLGGGDWGKVRLKSDTVRVSDVGPAARPACDSPAVERYASPAAA